MSAGAVRVWVVAVAVVLVGVRASAAGPSAPAQDTAELQERLAMILKETRTPGLAVAIANRDGIVWTAGIGLADVTTGKAVTPDTLFRVGSISKIFVALAILKLVEEARLSLDTPVRSLVPEVELANPWETTTPVRVAHLLEHTAGWDEIPMKQIASSDPKPLTLAEGLAIAPEARTSRWRPGTRYAYTNAGPAVAAAIVEKLTGRRFEDYVREAFFEPLGMATADYFYSARVRALLTQLYRSDGRTTYPYRHFALRPSGALNASAREMGAALRLLLRRGLSEGGRLLTEASIRRMETPVTSYGAQGGLGVGYGLCNGSAWNHGGLIWRGHTGGLDGGLSELYYLPNQGVGFFFSINSESWNALFRIGSELMAHLTRDLSAPVLPPARQVPAEISKAYEGWYVPASPRQQAIAFQERILGLRRLVFENTRMKVHSVVGPARTLVAVDGTRFRGETLTEANAVLMDTAEGSLFVWNDDVYAKIRPLEAWAQLALVVAFLISVISVPLFALVWVTRWLFGGLRGAPLLHVRVLPLVAWGCLAAGLRLAFELQRPEADAATKFGSPTLWSVGLTIATWAFAGASAASFLAAARAWTKRSRINRFAYYHSLAVAVVFVITTLYLALFGVIGYRTWASSVHSPGMQAHGPRLSTEAAASSANLAAFFVAAV